MKTDYCAVCGSKHDIEDHHVNPKSSGGSDDETNIISLCYIHHAMMHDITRPASFSSIHKLRIKGQRERGEYHGGVTEFGKKIVIKNDIKYLEWDESSNT